MLNYNKVPVHYMLSGMQRYVEHGIPPGEFLLAVLENNLQKAVAYVDATNAENIVEWARYCYNELPMQIWGSPAKVKAHIEACALKREAEL